ncbi:hypothetical protein G8O24_18490 [Bradyrhizobium sp. INPA01-394B]|uniref:Rhamnogalacturonase A/B/Epimerase-like pectate lyase domain-containing protein n=1 Tax=Bradyrhizobium campsiandrae TaxID=1729892 RepID=A0ABR7U9L1_9BRAD|nr:right-handed parallel beta-helix repeat-containing protein [Bradyrhizobium campsiandrae]MBC9879332.1 hypothetical protein [Bradyrhizobium campsiandrae]MBC9980738.1 hypothetical protein [Bradyrhizobium campsiandrae]
MTRAITGSPDCSADCSAPGAETHKETARAVDMTSRFKTRRCMLLVSLQSPAFWAKARPICYDNITRRALRLDGCNTSMIIRGQIDDALFTPHAPVKIRQGCPAIRVAEGNRKTPRPVRLRSAPATAIRRSQLVRSAILKPMLSLGLASVIACLSIAQGAAQPAIFWFNDPVGPDDTVLVTGAELGDVTQVTVGRIPDRESGGVDTSMLTVPVLQVSPQSLKFTVPREFERGIYQFTLTASRKTLSGRLNLPNVYWVQGSLGDAVTPDGSIQLFGRNIVRRAEHASLDLTPVSGAATIAATFEGGDSWRGRFSLPANISPGTYRLRLSNGAGGEHERVDAGTIEVKRSPAVTAQEFDVRAYGANGDGAANSTRGIVNAIAAAERAGGGTVYFPRGRYIVIEGLVIPPNVNLRGEATDLVNLVWPDFASPPEALIRGTSRFSIEDMTLYASNHRHVIAGGFLDGDRPAPDASDIRIRRVRIRASAFRGPFDLEATFRRMSDINRQFPYSGPDTIRLSGDRLELSDCDVAGTGRSLYLFKASNAVVARNILVNGRFGWYSITGSSRVVFEDNQVTAGDLQGNGGGINTLSNAVSASENVYVGHNSFKGIYGLDREAMTTDGPGGYYYGHAKTGGAQQVLLRDPPVQYPVSSDWTGAALLVVDGTGAGEAARVAKFERDPTSSQIGLRLDRTLQVALDATSTITVVQARQNYLVVGNQFEDCGVAAQSYGTGLNHVIADNTSHRTGGFFAIGLFYNHFQPSWQVQLLNNRIVEGNIYRAGASRSVLSEESAIGVHAYRTDIKPGSPPLVRAIILRGNRLEQDAHIEIKGSLPNAHGVRDVVIEDNFIGASRVGLTIDDGVTSAIERRNVIERRIGR